MIFLSIFFYLILFREYCFGKYLSCTNDKERDIRSIQIISIILMFGKYKSN